jgi:hypothetical protein
MGESQLDLLERVLARLDEYAETVSRAELISDLDTWLKVTRARSRGYRRFLRAPWRHRAGTLSTPARRAAPFRARSHGRRAPPSARSAR